jgi:hypothetical protein
MLLFRSEETVRAWCKTHRIPIRPLIDLEQLWHLAVTWYGNRLTAESRRPAADEIPGIFAGIGLEGHFWDPQTDVWNTGRL